MRLQKQLVIQDSFLKKKDFSLEQASIKYQFFAEERDKASAPQNINLPEIDLSFEHGASQRNL